MDPKTLRYAKSHEWAAVAGDVCTMGVTQHAAELLGDVTFLKLPKTGLAVKPGQDFGEIESVKSVSNLYSPVAGEVIEVNAKAVDTPSLVNESPYGDGWLVKIRLASGADTGHLLDLSGYETFVKSEGH